MNQYLSNIELYYTPPEKVIKDKLIVEGEEYSHIIKVMRHSLNDKLHVTNGIGKIYLARIEKLYKHNLELTIEKELIYENKFQNFFFCIPKLKSSERFEFALEKCVELGITNFFVFQSERSISKADRLNRWNKILLSAMKQSLNSFLPSIKEIKFEDIFKFEGKKIALEQNSIRRLSGLIKNLDEKFYFIFGPEGGFSERELTFFTEEDIYRITERRLRTETAIISCASLIVST